jgi:hypothetical protein
MEVGRHECDTDGHDGEGRSSGPVGGIFEIDESLEALVEAAEADAEANNGEVSEDIKVALATYVEALGYKVDRIADSLKAQRAGAEIAQREAERLQSRQNAAENREKRLKQMLVWFMLSRAEGALCRSCGASSIRFRSRRTACRLWPFSMRPIFLPPSTARGSSSRGRNGWKSSNRCPWVVFVIVSRRAKVSWFKRSFSAEFCRTPWRAVR